MAGMTLDWKDELGRWLKPFLDLLGHKARRQMCPLYVAGLIGPGDRKSVQPMAERLRRAIMINCTILSLRAFGMRRLWRRNCLLKRTGSSVAAMRCW
jgi:SRSO17 transposase